MFDSVEQSLVAMALGLVLGSSLFALVRLRFVHVALRAESARILDIFRERADKIPALIESIRRYAPDTPHVFESVLPVYERAVTLRADEVYGMIELDRKLSRELAFLLRFALHVDGLGRDGHFIAVRNFLVYYERAMTEKLRSYNSLIRSHNRLVHLKNWTILGLFVPVRELVEIA
jgi:hypothetical protein